MKTIVLNKEQMKNKKLVDSFKSSGVKVVKDKPIRRMKDLIKYRVTKSIAGLKIGQSFKVNPKHRGYKYIFWQQLLKADAIEPLIICKECNPTIIGNGYCQEHSTTGFAYLLEE